MTIEDWFWQQHRMPPLRAVVPADAAPLPSLLVSPVGSGAMQFNLADLDSSFQLAVQALNAMLAASPLAIGAVLYDPRLEVVRSYFLACGRGDVAVPVLAVAVRDEVMAMRDVPISAILGCELAKAGFLSMGLPQFAAPFAREAARGRAILQSLIQTARAEAARQEWPDVPTFSEAN